ncbi:ThuA domain-containing protein [Marinilongibacter aquaticus]|uniref:ThuA domain-containing protein n=1 Tax=Marinilongibacter aquaticus TaxID=2975157 RepID=UPI0021BD5AA2|nr:ThuA domain-containing protein [Marinilongibacter aquaticus]UBM58015.1 ThuA domain-containing protein [Marinilongibacter aquaticus]
MKTTKKSFRFGIIGLLFLLAFAQPAAAQFPRFKVLAFYSTTVEEAHVQFAKDAIKFFDDLTIGNGFVFESTANMADLNSEKIKQYDLIMMLNDFPHSAPQRAAFRDYMENGGGWLGFHVAAYNDKTTHWPWFVDFLGGAVFYTNNWPPMPAKLIVEGHDHEVTKGLPDTYIAPINEWYQWKPSPRENEDVRVLVSLSPDNYPFGLKDIIRKGDCPVVWTNTNYRMIYLNMGHAGHIFTDATQNKLIIDAFRWVVSQDEKGNPFEK